MEGTEVEIAIKPIATKYKGFRFRSRLEARWAIFFDKIGLKYEYEVEGFEMNGIHYLPDFYIPSLDRWFEIKVKPLSDLCLISLPTVMKISFV